MKHKGAMAVDETQGGYQGGTRGQYMKHKAGNEGARGGSR